MQVSDFDGETLDGKYRLMRELGAGGMGTVYLATHLGTERPVAVKVISPEYMQKGEFIERFRREARAAGRLRHPNVVNVTDFGFAQLKTGQAAYLVMEYLDGCTLGEILDEEKNLPVGWTLDILEQVCSAVQEAHTQGIIHRDLKPDNIWLEPNQRGGYTVKVLDFGIAKLEEQVAAVAGDGEIFKPATPTFAGSAKSTFAGVEATNVDGGGNTKIADAATVIQTAPHAASESETAIFDADISSEFATTIASGESRLAKTTGRSLYNSSGSAELTRVGAVLGTPLYMSPEQCRGEHLDARSDIYSLGVIAYQMLSGAPPFEGDFTSVMEAHKHEAPAPLKASKVRRKLKQAIHSALEKDPANRPQTAEGFASELRSRSEGLWQLLRRSMVIYSEHLPKFLLLTTFFSLPIIVLTLVVLGISFATVSNALPESITSPSMGAAGMLLSIANIFCMSLVIGCIGWIVTQHLAVPLRPIRLRPALVEVQKKWKRFAGTSILASVLPFVVSGVAATAGFVVFAALLGMMYPLTGSVAAIFVGGIIGAALLGTAAFFAASTFWILVAPVVMMENLGVIKALRRSRRLVKRSFATALGAVAIMFLLPAVIAGGIHYLVGTSAKAFDPTSNPPSVTVSDGAAPAAAAEEPKPGGLTWSWGKSGASVKSGPDRQPADMQTRVMATVYESLIQILWLPMQIIVFSFTGIIVALLYLKTRLAGGESMNELIERFEDDGRPRKKWQERVRARLIQSGRISSNPSR